MQGLAEEHLGGLSRRLRERPHVDGSVHACSHKLAAAVEREHGVDAAGMRRNIEQGVQGEGVEQADLAVQKRDGNARGAGGDAGYGIAHEISLLLDF